KVPGCCSGLSATIVSTFGSATEACQACSRCSKLPLARAANSLSATAAGSTATLLLLDFSAGSRSPSISFGGENDSIVDFRFQRSLGRPQDEVTALRYRVVQ